MRDIRRSLCLSYGRDGNFLTRPDNLQNMDSEPMLKMICARIGKNSSVLPDDATERGLEQRYEPVLPGLELLSSREHIDTYLVDFEDSLLDSQVCMEYRTTTVLLPERSDTMLHYIITDCPLESHGHPDP